MDFIALLIRLWLAAKHAVRIALPHLARLCIPSLGPAGHLLSNLPDTVRYAVSR